MVMHVRWNLRLFVRYQLSARHSMTQTSSHLVASLCRKPRPYSGMLMSCWSNFGLQLRALDSSSRLQMRRMTRVSMKLIWLLMRTPRLSACAPLYALASLLRQLASRPSCWCLLAFSVAQHNTLHKTHLEHCPLDLPARSHICSMR